MKQEILQTANPFIRRGLSGTLMMGAILLFFIPYSGNTQGKYTGHKSNPIIKYIGTVEDKLVFHVELDNVTENQLFISIKDDDGTILFTEKVKDQKFSKKFAFSKEEFRNRRITFEVNSPRTNTTQTFAVAHNLRLVEDIVVTRF